MGEWEWGNGSARCRRCKRVAVAGRGVCAHWSMEAGGRGGEQAGGQGHVAGLVSKAGSGSIEDRI